MYDTFEEFNNHLFDLREHEKAHIKSYEEYRKKHALDDKHDYISSVYVPDSYLTGRTITCHFHDRFSAPNYHTHNFFELIYIVEGEFVNIVEGHEFTMKKGDICLLPPHIYHSFDDVEKEFSKRTKSFAINIFIKESSAERYLSGFGSDSLDRFISSVTAHTNHRKFALFSKRSDSICDMLMRLLSFELLKSLMGTNDSVAGNRLADSLMSAVISEILSPAYSLSFSPSFTNNSATGDIIKYISDNYKSVTLEEVAENFNYSFSYASKLIKQRTGLGFSALLTGIRIDRACEMLSSTDMTIKEICTECGYGSLEHFHRAFKRVKMMTPSKYREISHSTKL